MHLPGRRLVRRVLLHAALLVCAQPSRRGRCEAGLRAASPDLPGPCPPAAPSPPRLLTQQAPSTLRPFLRPNACICVFLDDCFLITPRNYKSWLGTQVTSSDEPSDHQNLGTAPGQGATETASEVLAATRSCGATLVPTPHVRHVGGLVGFLEAR